MAPIWRRTALGLLVAVPVLAFILYQTDLGETADALEQANYALIPLAVLLFLLAIWLSAVRWRYLLRSMADVPAGRLYPVVFIGHLGNSVLPLRGGDVLRAVVLKRREGISRAASLGTLVVEHVLDGTVLVGVLLIFIGVMNRGEGIWEIALVSGVVFVGASLALVAAAIWQAQSAQLADFIVDRAPKRWREELRSWISSFLRGTRGLRSAEVAAAVLVTTIGFWLAIATAYLVVGRSFHIDESFDTYLLATAAANLAFSVPLTQGGLGSFEFLVRQTLIFAGVDAAVATAYALALHALIIGSMVSAGLVSIWLVGLSANEIGDQAAASDVPEPESPTTG